MIYTVPGDGAIRVSSPYGIRKHPVTGETSMHNGIDMVIENREVLSSAEGVVKAVGEDTLAGKYVIISHENGTETHYYHVDRYVVGNREHVTAGQMIAIQGKTGRVTGEHLHFGIKMNDNFINPASELKILNKIGILTYEHWGIKYLHDCIRDGIIIFEDKNMEENPTWAEILSVISSIRR